MIDEFKKIYQDKRQLVEEKIKIHLSQSSLMQDIPMPLKQAMGYCLSSEGKRIRAVLILLVHDLIQSWAKKNEVGVQLHGTKEMLDIALAVEMIHTYSLIHDDLPAMDDDDLRRGQPSCHIKFDEATAILTGDSWLNQSFELLSGLTGEHAREVINFISESSGARGMIGGQMLDLAETGELKSQKDLEQLHFLKTGKLIQASVLAPVLYYQIDEIYHPLKNYGAKIGLAFQIIDDVLDATQSNEILGKNAQSDASNDKFTFVDLMGVSQAKRYGIQLIEEANASVDSIRLDEEVGKRNLKQLALYVIERSY